MHLEIADDLKPTQQDDISMDDQGKSSRSVSPTHSGTSTCSTPTSLTGDPLDKRAEDKRRRAEDKRRKELEKKNKESAKKKAKVDELKNQTEEEKEAKSEKRCKAKENDDSVYIPHVSTLTERDMERAEAKNKREAARQEVWNSKDEALTKEELRAYYKDTKSKPKGKTPTKQSRQFADL